MTDAERAEVQAFAARQASRPRPPRFKAAKKADGSEAVSPADDSGSALFVARVARTVGASEEAAAEWLMGQAALATESAALADKCNTAMALLAGIGPRDEAEGMLAVQMVAAHNLALSMARRALKTDRVDFLATYSNLSAKLMNVYTRQLEALARLRGQTGQQTVRVEHVTVQAGGQAVVGNVAPRGRGDDEQG
ncbi:hypothetical protein KF840_18815 [bacterium]|nr:hypothetical protein [bacterium]